MEAAIPVVMFSGMLSTRMQDAPELESLFTGLNQSLHEALDKRKFVCFTMADINLKSRVMRLAMGGCPPPLHYRAETGDVIELEMAVYPLGIRAEATYETMEVQLEEGDLVVFYSDGLVEAQNELGEMYGFDQTKEDVRIAGGDGSTSQAAVEELVSRVSTFSGSTPQGDDITCVAVRVKT
jgi:sigma-B regulation protein RsbU (phosphoserine phosphatase)